MANEYKLSYTAQEIDEKLGKVGKPFSWNDLTDKPFYEEKGVFEPIVWDGNTEVLETVQVYEDVLGKISEDYVSITDTEQINRVDITDSNGTSSIPFDFFAEPNGWHVFSVDQGSPLFIASDGNLMIDDVALSEGIWILTGMPDDASIVMYSAPTVHKIDKKYLPSNMCINLTEDEDGNIVADKSYDEITEVLRNGIIPYCRYGNVILNFVKSDELYDIAPYVSVNEHKFSAVVPQGTANSYVICATFNSAGNVSIDEYILTVTEPK